MTSVLRALSEITTGYSVFEKDQVLTHDQLNSIAGYLDDQTRLTRVKLIGVGIVYGLKVSLSNNVVTVSKGTAVTTDGDLLYFDSDTSFEQFKLYDESNPEYAPLKVEDKLIAAYQLVQKQANDERAADLSIFATQTGIALADTTALLLMESYIKDDDICTSTDCDNLGKDYINNIKLILISKKDAAGLQEAVATADGAAATLAPIFADRPLIPTTLSSVAQLNKIYSDTCASIQNKLSKNIVNVFPALAPWLSDVFAADPSNTWQKNLADIQGRFVANATGIQYYYDFLKDVIDTYNALAELLFGDFTWPSPNADAFAKHVLLGDIVPGTNPTVRRTGYYPSPAVSWTKAQIDHAKFLAKKIDVLLATFLLPNDVGAPIRITPSLFEDKALEQRAIPYYYAIDEKNPIQEYWNYALYVRSRAGFNYSYNAAAYTVEGPALQPLTAQVGRFPFLRIEGHLGKDVTAAVDALKSEVIGKNLPFAVQAVLLDSDHSKIKIRPDIGYGDLHRFHYLLRQDMYYQLDEVGKFSANLKDQVNFKVSDLSETEKQGDIKLVAEQKNATILNGVNSARATLSKSYADYSTTPTWKDDFSTTLTSVSAFKTGVADIVKTEIATPFDSLVGNTQGRWLDWLDELIKQKHEHHVVKQLFSNFAAKNPGIEHFGGVTRGGTFVLLYDANGTVIGDFSLPYHLDDVAETQPIEPILPPPHLVLDRNQFTGISLTTSRTKLLSDFNINLTKNFSSTLEAQKGSVFQDAIKLITSVPNIGKAINVETPQYADPQLGYKVQEVNIKQQMVEDLQQKLLDPGLAADKRTLYEKQMQDTQAELANSIKATADYVAVSGSDVSVGAEGHTALLDISSSMKSLSDSGAKNLVVEGLNNIGSKTNNIALKNIVGNMVKF